MSKSDSLDRNNQTSDAPFTIFVRLDGKSSVPSEFHAPNTFTITRLRSPAGLPDRITKLSAASSIELSTVRSRESIPLQSEHSARQGVGPSAPRTGSGNRKQSRRSPSRSVPENLLCRQ